MPLRDHFHEPLLSAEPWPSFHALWPAMAILRLNPLLPSDYRVEPRVQIGVHYEIDVGAVDRGPGAGGGRPSCDDTGTAVLTRSAPTLDVGTELDDPTEIGLRVLAPGRILVAAVEFVSPANKDRPEKRRAFAEKVADLVRQGVSVSVVDIVGNAHFNLYADTLGVIGHTDPALGVDPPGMYAVTCRTFGRKPHRRLASWFHPLAVGRPLPTLPLWLHDDERVNLELELSYEDTCRVLRMG
jgi:hypothetical protein